MKNTFSIILATLWRWLTWDPSVLFSSYCNSIHLLLCPAKWVISYFLIQYFIHCYTIYQTIWLRTYCTLLLWHMVKGLLNPTLWLNMSVQPNATGNLRQAPPSTVYSHNVTSATYECTLCYVHNQDKQTPSASWIIVLLKSLICFITSLWHLTLLSSVITCLCVYVCVYFCVCFIVNAASGQNSVLLSWRCICQTDTVFYP